MGAGYTIAEVADRAGAPLARVDALVDAGVIPRRDAYDEGAVRRAMLLSACVEAGLTVEALGAAMASGHLELGIVDADHYARWGQRLDTTWAELAAAEGLDLAFLGDVFRAIGLALLEADDRPRIDDPAMLRAFAIVRAAEWDRDAILRLTRVYGESLRRITRTETELWHQFVDVPMERAGASQREIMGASEAFGESIMGVIDDMMLTMYRRMQEHAWMGDLVEHIELSLVEAGVYEKPERPTTLAFMDVSGYTMLTEERGDHAAADVATTLAVLVQRAAADHGGEVMKWLGDGVMLRFPEPAAGVRGSLDVVHATTPAGLPPAHVGLAVGAVVERDGDVFGRTVNLAARISDVAGPGQVLVTRETVDAVRDDDLAFAPFGAVPLQGVAAPVELFVAAAGAGA